ncbi:MAG: metal ABC transporter ATP-binding protein, partial [Thermoguttaceae bacterium]|nr:metal ABC transporter ATP-binding protein [Thermoguttaceae bacterium]
MISLKNVSYYYAGSREPALANVDLTIPRGEFASIVGPNGGGKTTLIRLILGLARPSEGTVELFGGDPEKTRLRAGYAPQQARVDYRFPIAALDVVLAGRFGAAKNRPAWRQFFFRFTKDDREKALAAMEKMGVADLRDRAFGELSGGQRQRVLIARALCSEPELLVLDEPVNNIDPSSAEKFYDLLAELNRSTAILMASHDLGVVSTRVHSAICVNRTVQVHPTSEFDGALVRELYHSDVRLVRHDHRCSESGHFVEER